MATIVKSDILWEPMSMKQAVYKPSIKCRLWLWRQKDRPIPSICLYPHLNEWMAVPGWNGITVVKLTKESSLSCKDLCPTEGRFSCTFAMVLQSPFAKGPNIFFNE